MRICPNPPSDDDASLHSASDDGEYNYDRPIDEDGRPIGDDGEPDRVLDLIRMHATGLSCLSLELSTSWGERTESWTSLGKMTNLTELQLTFAYEVRSARGVG
jgi:hypothetical protein